MEKNEKMKCKECGEDLSPEEQAHDAFNEGLESITQLVSLSPLPVGHYLTLGLAYFIDQIYTCAPDNEEAERVITEITAKCKEENNG